MELFKQEMELFPYFQTSDEKNSLTKYLPYLLRSPNPVLQTGNGIIQTGNGTISPISRPLIKKLLLQNVSNFFQ